jgi:homoserine kinase
LNAKKPTYANAIAIIIETKNVCITLKPQLYSTQLNCLLKQNMNEITILSPATVANFVCGYDVLGFALNEPYDEMTLRLRDDSEIKIINKSDYELPLEPEKNVASVAVMSLVERFGRKVGFDIEITKNIKPGSGIGSSSASSAGAVVAANLLLGDIFDKKMLVDFAMDGEKIASGSRHADNVAPCIYGGVTLVRSTNPLDIISLSSPILFVTIVHPQIEVKTSDARKILQQRVLLKDAIKQWGNVAGLVAGLLQNDYGLISRSLEDFLIEPTRSILIPAFDEVKRKSIETGSLGGGISGSGPSIFMLSKDEKTARNVEKTMSEIYTRIGLDFHTYVSTINKYGVKIKNNS